MSAERKLAEEALHDFEHYASEVHDGFDECAEDVADAAGRILDLVDKLVAERDAAAAMIEFICPCGSGNGIDEDGLCNSCGEQVPVRLSVAATKFNEGCVEAKS